jgi:hypothetical protein
VPKDQAGHGSRALWHVSPFHAAWVTVTKDQHCGRRDFSVGGLSLAGNLVLADCENQPVIT